MERLSFNVEINLHIAFSNTCSSPPDSELTTAHGRISIHTSFLENSGLGLPVLSSRLKGLLVAMKNYSDVHMLS